MQTQSRFGFRFLYLIQFIHLYRALQTCGHDNRRIFTSDQGTVSNGPWLHKHSQRGERCEYLIKGKPGETITLNFHIFRTECTYDHVFVHDGASRSSKLLAVLTGKKDGTQIVSSTHQVYIILHTDNDDPTGIGFNLNYTINQCPNKCSGHGTCNDDHTCQCNGNRYGEACQFESCPEFKGVHCSEARWCNANSKRCVCPTGFYGEACSLSELPNENLNTWHNITVYSDILKSRAGHVSAYIEQLNILIVHGGYSFNEINANTVFYNFSSSAWYVASIIGSNKPTPRFDHSGVGYKDSFIIFGGELGNGSYINELWLFNCSRSTWHMLDSSFPFGLKLHTMNLVGELLYIFGGQTNEYLMSSQIYIYNLAEKSWKNPPHVYGNDLSLRLYGHSTIFYEDLRSLVIFGGFHSKVRLKLGELTNRLLLYNIDNKVWSDISDLENAPPPLAYHTSVIIGNYMVIFGGLAVDTKSHFCPISSRFYYYNLHCGVWVSQETLAKQYNLDMYPWLPNARFSHTAVMKNNQTLIIVGGYDQSTILSDVVAYQLPKSVFYIEPSTGMEAYGAHCSHYTDKDSCEKDPSCAYCSHGCIAYSKASSACTSEPDSNICKGICRHFRSCEMCTAQTIFDKRKQDDDDNEEHWCNWCTLDRTCYSEQNSEQHCKIGPEMKSKCKITVGEMGSASWWGSNSGKTIDKMKECQLYDNRTGMRMLQYTNKPFKDDYPDSVKVMKSAAEISRTLKTLKHTENKQKVVVIGFVYPYFCYENEERSYHALRIQDISDLRANDLRAELYIYDSKWNTSVKHSKQPVARFNSGEVLVKKGGLFPIPSDKSKFRRKLSYLLNLTMFKTGPVKSLDLSWAHSGNEIIDPSFTNISANYLQFYYHGLCSEYTSCMGCIIDSSCGWNHQSGSCWFISDWWRDRYDSTIYLSRDESQCVKCDDYFDCRTCLNDSHCVWADYDGCKMSDQQVAAYVTKEIDKCPQTCEKFVSSIDCINKGYGCVWCLKKRLCISLSEFHLHVISHQCYTFESRVQRPCNVSRNCSTCLQYFKCGWVFNVSDPRIGFCIKGDFAGPSYTNMTGWSYGKCPDIDECRLGIDKCVNNSKCVNNVTGTYQCPCNEGFEGDGRILCKKMCWPKCMQGECTKDKVTGDMKCICHLGWKGVDCATDCGCYNHSTCVNATCDHCQDLTRGSHCEHCVNGSYGNATTLFGCKKCNCNYHGDPSQNFCNMTDGTCYCLNNTAGKNCEKCLPNFSHTPVEYRHTLRGPACHLNCNRANIKFVNASGWLVASREKNTSPFITCLWILTGSNLSHDALIFNQTKLGNSILLRLHALKASCSETHLSIYDGVPPNPRIEGSSLRSNFRLLNSVCSLNSKNNIYRSETGILTLVYEGRTLHKKDDLPKINEPVNEFLGEYRLLSCPDECPAPLKCTADKQCACEYGRHGPLCEHEICKNNCSSSIGGGICDITSSKCRCNYGFYGEDCSMNVSTNHFSIQRINVIYKNMNHFELERLSSTMVVHEHTLYVFGGSHFYDFHEPLFVQFDIYSNEWKPVEFSGRTPAHRFAHCSFVYNHHVYVFGGIGRNGFLNDIWKFSLSTNMWIEIKKLNNLPKLAGHSCTLVDDSVYIFGGYVPEEGLNELQCLKLFWDGNEEKTEVLTFGNLEPKPKPMYGHVAVYDRSDENIYFHGGVMHYEEKIKSSPLIHVYNVRDGSWNYHEKETGEFPPSLVGHTGQLTNSSMYLFGGYTDHVSFNEKIYVWNIKCNKWYVLTADRGLDGNGKTDLMFLNSVNFNGSIFIFGGFNGNVSSNINVFSVPHNPCGRHSTSTECLEEDCYWCDTTNHSVCFSHSVPQECNDNQATLTYENKCKKQNILLRKCNTFTSCISCLSTYPYSRTKCHWCRCLRDSGKCYGEHDECECKKHYTLSKCYEVFCEGSSCRNCQGNCIWTNYLQYKSESRRFLNRNGLEFNCFLKGLLVHLPPHATVFDYRVCPWNCNTYKDCTKCLASDAYGIDGGAKYCIWSDKLSECLAPAVLSLRCSFGLCGQLYVPNMQSECPTPCSTKKSCFECIKSIGCGWCEITGSNTGSCMKGDLRGTYDYSNCSSITHQRQNVPSVSYTWAYASCPLKDECYFNVHNCDNATEECRDETEGFTCLCKEGYQRISSICKPVCNGCVHGLCRKPNDCTCLFGWTGKNCNVSCECNNHSHCKNESSKGICIECFNNTQGNHCSECKPFFVGNPVGGTCRPCKSYCNYNADKCVTKEEYQLMKGNHSLLQNITKGPKDNAVCIDCKNHSFGDKCEQCVVGYFLGIQKMCIKCQCNGHGHTCNSRTGKECNCSHNTETPVSDILGSYGTKQCSRCKIGFHGNPLEGSQCYGILTRDVDQKIKMKSEDTAFLYVTPNFSNVNLRIILDIYEGEIDVYLTSAYGSETIFKVKEEDNAPYTQTLNLTRKVDANITSTRYSTLAKYNVTNSVLLIKGVRHRLAIHIPHNKHDFQRSKFYIALSSINKIQSEVVHGRFYFCQDQPKLNLVLFFLTLIVILMLILSGFILGWKVRTEFVQHRGENRQEIELQRLQKRPFASYKLRCECNEDIDIIRKRKDRNNVGQNKISNGSKQNNNNLDTRLTPLLVQNTDDCLASVVTVMMQFPENEFSLWNLSLASGIFQSNSQQVLHVKTSNFSHGRKVDTRFLNTQVT